MREIKFRVWYKGESRMYLDIREINFQKKNIRCEHIKYPEGANIFSFNEIILMQFTGLKDKNGQEIFEGDIVSLLPLRIGDPTVYAEIKFEDGSFDMFGINRPVNTKQIRFVRELYVECLTNHVEVIGNRFENPELLEKIK